MFPPQAYNEWKHDKVGKIQICHWATVIFLYRTFDHKTPNLTFWGDKEHIIIMILSITLRLGILHDITGWIFCMTLQDGYLSADEDDLVK